MRTAMLFAVLVLVGNATSEAQLAGSFTVGPNGTYVDCDAAVAALLSQGVDGPVTFTLEPGTYGPTDPARAVIDIDGEIPGASAVNRVTFQPDIQNGGNVDNVVLERAQGGDLADDGVFVQIRSDFVTIRSLTMNYVDTSTTERAGDAVYVRAPVGRNSLQGVELIGCKINGSSGTSRLLTAFRCVTENTDFVIQDNVVDGCHNGFYFPPQTWWTRTARIEGNTVTGMRIWITGGSEWRGECVSLGPLDDVTIRGNVFDYANGGSGAFAIRVYAGGGRNLKILENQIGRIGGGQGAAPNDVFRTIEVRDVTGGLVANNMIAGIWTNYRTGIKVVSDDIDVLHNSVILPPRSGPGWVPNAGIHIDGTGNRVMMNIIADYSSSGNRISALLFENSAGNQSDYNNLYSATQATVRADNANYATLEAWQQTGFDQNSVSKPPSFVQRHFDLHLADCSVEDPDLRGTALAEVPRDFDGEERDPVAPFMGADETEGDLPSLFGLPRQYASGELSWQFTEGDLDDDGDIDLVVTNAIGGSNDVSLLWNDGSGDFSQSERLDFGGDPYSPKVGNLNDDDRPDVIVTTGGAAYVRYNLGGGAFGPLRPIEAPVSNTTLSGQIVDLALGDLDRDGRTDMLVCGYVAEDPPMGVYSFINFGNETFNVNRWSNSGEFFDQVALRDLNGDQYLDVILVDAIQTERVYVLLNLGRASGEWLGFDSSLIELPELVYSIPSHSTLLVEDFDGNGAVDIIVRQSRSLDTMVFYANDGNANFTVSQFVVHTTHTPYALATFDYNRDGHPDIVSANNTRDLHVLLNDGNGNFELFMQCFDSEFGAPPRAILTASLDQDESHDVAVLGADDIVSIFSNVGWVQTGIDDPHDDGGIVIDGGPPSVYRLARNVPNPFNPITTVGFELPEPARVHLAIYDARGRLVRTLVSEYKATGRHAVVWDGRDAHGRNVASGVYLYRMRTPRFWQTRRMVVLR